MIIQRWLLSRKYLAGTGIEIGGLNRPLKVPKDVKVRYVDLIDNETAKNVIYPNLKKNKVSLVNVDIVDDGEKLSSISQESQDFIIANHFLEHTQNPIKTIKNHLSRLKVNGILFYCVPDKRKTFDKNRPITTFEHVLKDFKEGPGWSYESHLHEYIELIQHPKSKISNEKLVEGLRRSKKNIHFHVWDRDALYEFLEKTNQVLEHPFEIIEFIENKNENIIILRKTQPENLTKKIPQAEMLNPVTALMRVYFEREDLQKEFPEASDGKDLSRLINWAKIHGSTKDELLMMFKRYYENLADLK